MGNFFNDENRAVENFHKYPLLKFDRFEDWPNAVPCAQPIRSYRKSLKEHRAPGALDVLALSWPPRFEAAATEIERPIFQNHLHQVYATFRLLRFLPFLLLFPIQVPKLYRQRSIHEKNGIWIITGGTRKITACSGIFYGVNSNFCYRHRKMYWSTP